MKQKEIGGFRRFSLLLKKWVRTSPFDNCGPVIGLLQEIDSGPAYLKGAKCKLGFNTKVGESILYYVFH